MRLGLRHTTKTSLGLFSRTNAIDNYTQRAMIRVLQASLGDGQFLSICPYLSIYGLPVYGSCSRRQSYLVRRVFSGF